MPSTAALAAEAQHSEHQRRERSVRRSHHRPLRRSARDLRLAGAGLNGTLLRRTSVASAMDQSEGSVRAPRVFGLGSRSGARRLALTRARQDDRRRRRRRRQPRWRRVRVVRAPPRLAVLEAAFDHGLGRAASSNDGTERSAENYDTERFPWMNSWANDGMAYARTRDFGVSHDHRRAPRRLPPSSTHPSSSPAPEVVLVFCTDTAGARHAQTRVFTDDAPPLPPASVASFRFNPTTTPTITMTSPRATSDGTTGATSGTRSSGASAWSRSCRDGTATLVDPR